MEKNLERTRDVLKASPRGLTVTDVAEKLQISRYSSAKYLEMLLMAGQVDMRTFGRSKIFSLSHRMPMSTMLSLSSDMIVFIDERLQVIEANEQFLKFAEAPRDKVIGQGIESTWLPLLLHREILLNIRDALRGREFVREISTEKGRSEYYFKVKIIPAVAQGGQQMAAIIYENITDRKKAGLALKESEEKYRFLVEHSKDLIWQIDLDSRWTFVGGNLEEATGFRPAEVVGRTVWDLLAPECHALVRDRQRRRILGEDVPPYEVLVVCKDGHKVPYELSAAPVYDAEGKIAGINGVSRDISRRKKAEVALKESEARYRAIVDDQTEMICRMLPDTTITFVNEAWCRNFLVKTEDVTGKKHIDFIPSQFKHLYRKDIESLRPERPVNIVETAIVMPDGNKQWIRYTHRGLFGEDQRLAELQIVAHDITDRKQAELALKESEARYRAVVEGQTDIIMRMLPDTTITFLNDACSRYFGVNNADFIGRRFTDMLPPGHRGTLEARLGELSSDSPLGSAEDTTVPANTEPRWLHWTYCGIFDDGGVIREYQIVARDITERKLAELALKDSEARYRMLIENAPVGIFTCDRQGNVTSVNQKILELMGSKSPDFTRSVNLLSFEPLVQSGLLTGIYDQLIKGEPVIREGSYTSYWGKTVYMRLHLQPLRDSAGEISGTLGIAEDITERRQTDEALRRSEEKYRILVENSRDIIYQMDLRGILTFVSGNVEQLTGYRADEVVGRSIRDFLALRCCDLATEIHDRRIMDKEIPPFEIQLKCKDGSYHLFEISASAVTDRDGKIVGSQGVARDITERKRLMKS